MKAEKIRALGEWLGGYHSHGVYAETAFDELEPIGFTYKDGVITEVESGKSVRVPLQSSTVVRQEIEARGLGGSVADTSEPLWTGYVLSTVLACWTLGRDPSGHLNGRGTRFATQVQAMRTFGRQEGAA